VVNTATYTGIDDKVQLDLKQYPKVTEDIIEKGFSVND
jgi:hypothetical protein